MHFSPHPAEQQPCWHCEHFSGFVAGGAHAACELTGRRRVQATPATGCAFWMRVPGVDDEPGPAGFDGSRGSVEGGLLLAQRPLCELGAETRCRPVAVAGHGRLFGISLNAGSSGTMANPEDSTRVLERGRQSKKRALAQVGSGA